MANNNLRRTIAFVLIAAVGVLGISTLTLAKRSVVESDTELFIKSGTDYNTLLEQLDEAGVEGKGVVNFIARIKKLDRGPKPGHYILPKGATPMQIVNTLRGGAQKPVRLTFNNIRTLEQLAGRLSEQIEADSVSILAHLKTPETAARYDIAPEEVIGLFLPNTYEVWWTVTPEELTDRMHSEWEKFWNPKRTKQLERTRLSKMEAISLAAIVYEETKNVGEMPKIAGVYINRLRRGMPLQACPTAKYAVGDFSIKRVLHKHTQTKSPYNTYLHRGLTPGPICIPSIAAIDAVLGYTAHNYLYFCAKEDFSGRHNFSTNLSQHNRYAEQYARALRRAGIK